MAQGQGTGWFGYGSFESLTGSFLETFALRRSSEPREEWDQLESVQWRESVREKLWEFFKKIIFLSFIQLIFIGTQEHSRHWEIESISSHRSSQTSEGDWQVEIWILIQAEGCKGRGVWREPGKLWENLNPCQTQALTRWYGHTLGHSGFKESGSTWSLLLILFLFFFTF